MIIIVNDGEEHTFVSVNMTTLRWVKSNAELAIVNYNLVHHMPGGYWENGKRISDPAKVTNYKVDRVTQLPAFGVIVGDNPYTS